MTRGDALAVCDTFFFGHTVRPPNYLLSFCINLVFFFSEKKKCQTSRSSYHFFLSYDACDEILHSFRRVFHSCSSRTNVRSFDLRVSTFLSFLLCTSFVDAFFFGTSVKMEYFQKKRWDHATWKCEHTLQEHTAALNRGNAQEEETWHL